MSNFRANSSQGKQLVQRIRNIPTEPFKADFRSFFYELSLSLIEPNLINYKQYGENYRF